jgi:hypothetical protein
LVRKFHQLFFLLAVKKKVKDVKQKKSLGNMQFKTTAKEMDCQED